MPFDYHIYTIQNDFYRIHGFSFTAGRDASEYLYVSKYYF